jgi:hypothetical protein
MANRIDVQVCEYTAIKISGCVANKVMKFANENDDNISVYSLYNKSATSSEPAWCQLLHDHMVTMPKLEPLM